MVLADGIFYLTAILSGMSLILSRIGDALWSALSRTEALVAAIALSDIIQQISASIANI